SPRRPPPFPENNDAPRIRKDRQGGRSNPLLPYLEIPAVPRPWAGRSPSFRLPLLSLLRSPGRLGGARLRPRGQDRIHERDEAYERPGDQPAGPEHRPGRWAAQLHRELRAHVDL